jgi:predicted CXXCH cytochrome family protein
MRKWITCLAAAVPLLASTFALASIAGSKHDFSTATWSDQAICKPCHTPHNAIAQDITARLWAHTLSTQATYIGHGSTLKSTDGGTTLEAQGTLNATTDLDGATRLCLSCHDGTVALDSFMGRNATTSDGVVMGGDANHGSVEANLGTDLSNDHPVGLTTLYKDSTIGGYNNPYSSAVAAGLKFVISPTPVSATDLPKVPLGTNGQPLYTNYPAVSCITCHDTHNGSVPTERGLLRVSNVGSKICLTCHNK